MEFNNESKNVEQLNEVQQNIEDITEMKEELSLSEVIAKDLSEGIHSNLFKRINSITIAEPIIRDAFSSFIKAVECGSSFSISDIICSAESLMKNGSPNENAGNLIFCFENYVTSNKRLSSKLLKNSVMGIYPLFSLSNGIALDIGVCGGNLVAAETKRYLIAPESKAKKLVDEASTYGIRMVRAGVMLSSNSIILTLGSDTIANINKETINSSKDNYTVNIGREHLPAFVSGYNSVCSYALCNCVNCNNILRFGLGDTLSDICARALGYYVAAMWSKQLSVKMAFTSDNTATVVTPKPTVADGDYLYLLKLRKDQLGIPEKGHFGQLCYYLSEKKRVGIIKDVLPVRENILPMIKRLCNDKIEYVQLDEVPADCFGVIVSVKRGDSVNGIRLGYFKSN